MATFDRVLAVSFAFPEEALRALVPDYLEIERFAGLGFLTVALVWTRDLRPAGFPRWLGQDFFLAGYRIFTRFQEPDGRRLRGLRILRSETDQARMVRVGNWLTGYRYRQVRVAITETVSQTRIQCTRPDGRHTLDLTFDAGHEPVGLPEGSPFADWRSARRFAGPMPFTFSPEEDGSVTIIEGRREDWTPRPVRVLDWRVGLFEEAPLRGLQPVLANAFAVDQIAYRWEKGRNVWPGEAQP